MQAELLNYAKKIPDYLKLLTMPYQIGFVQEHSHLTNQQLFELKQILNSGDTDDIVRTYERHMTDLIGQGYGVSFAACRMAFFTLLKVLDVGPGDEIILPGFTCSVMPNAVWRTGATPVFSDIDIQTFGSSAEGIEKKVTSRTKVVVAQHSFGIPCNIGEIADLCKKKEIFLIEDCAITLDSSFEGISVGNWGDAAVFSTDHSKPLNTIIGGFLYTKNRSLYEKAIKISSDMSHLEKAHQERLYNQFMFERENYMPERYPRTIFINQVKNIIRYSKHPFTFLEGDYNKRSSSGTGYPYPAKMPPFLAQLGLFEIDCWAKEKKRRKDLLKQYLCIAEQLYIKGYLPEAYFNSSFDIVPLRFVFQHPDSERIMKKMSRYIDTKWTWFKEPIICCPEGPESLGYSPGSCQVAEKACQNIINWPCAVPENWDHKVIEIFKDIIKYAN